LIARFAEEVTGLGDKLGMVLIQFPPSLIYDESRAIRLFVAIGATLPCRLACESRHPSWFEKEPDAALDRLRISRVAADPAILPAAAIPGGWLGARYHRLHGMPKIYHSSYDMGRIETLGATLASEAADGIGSWCVFDNTALGFATANALALHAALARALIEGRRQLGIERT
jgi:uncharacterized protein YecE (DUF72 family)